MKKLMKISISVFVFIISVTLLFGQGISRADTILFQDNFNAENGGYAALNFNSFTKWDVTSRPGYTNGTVDLIGQGSSWDFHPGNGLYVDLDGSTLDAGVLTTKASFTYLPNTTYWLEFDLGSSQPPGEYGYGAPNEVTVSFVTELYTITADDALTHYIIEFTDSTGPMTTPIVFSNAGGDNIGAVLDNVTLSQVPEPTTLLLLGLGLIGLAGVRRKF